MVLQIDDAFVAKWGPKYDCTENDEACYQNLVRAVARDMRSDRTIAKNTFLAIWKWKGAMRVIRRVLIDEYDTRYAPAFRLAASEPPERKLAALLAPEVKLPGVGGPTGSTIIHFIHPESMPIIDVRTVNVLREACRVKTRQSDLAHYEEFRRAMGDIKNDCPSWNLRQIDRALFAYHKQLPSGASKSERRRECPNF